MGHPKRSIIISSGISFCECCKIIKSIDNFYYKFANGSLYKCKSCIAKKRIKKTPQEKKERIEKNREITKEIFESKLKSGFLICKRCLKEKQLNEIDIIRKLNRIGLCYKCEYEKNKVYVSRYCKKKYIQKQRRINPNYVYREDKNKIERDEILKKGSMVCSSCKKEKQLRYFKKRQKFYERRCTVCINNKRKESGVGKRTYEKIKKYYNEHPLEKEKHNKYLCDLNKKYTRRQIINLEDRYIKRKLGIPCPSKELIELKRGQLKIIRAVRNVSSHKVLTKSISGSIL